MEIDKTNLKFKEKKFATTYQIIIYDESKIIAHASGFGSLDVFYSTYVSVIEDYQNKGLGTLLKNKQIEFAKSEGYTSLETFVALNNDSAIKMQEKIGCTLNKIDNMYYCYLDLK